MEVVHAVSVGHPRVVDEGALGAASTDRPASDGHGAVPSPILLDDVVGACHAADRRRDLHEQAVQRALAEHVHILVVTVKDLAALRGEVDLIGRDSLLVDYTGARGNKTEVSTTRIWR